MHASIRKRWLAPALALAALVALSPASADAQTTGATTLTIEMPNIIVLHYFSTVDITIDTATLEAYLDFTDGDTVDEGGATGSDFDADLDIETTPLTGPTGDVTDIALTLSNAWAVRAMGPSGNSTQVTVTNSGTLDHGTSGSIAISSSTVQVAGGSGFGATAAFAPPGLISPQVGDVQLALDMTNATLSGDYAGTYTVSVTTL